MELGKTIAHPHASRRPEGAPGLPHVKAHQQNIDHQVCLILASRESGSSGYLWVVWSPGEARQRFPVTLSLLIFGAFLGSGNAPEHAECFIHTNVKGHM